VPNKSNNERKCHYYLVKTVIQFHAKKATPLLNKGIHRIYVLKLGALREFYALNKVITGNKEKK